MQKLLNKSLHDKAILSVVVLISFFLPLSKKIIPPLIVVWVLLWILRGNFKEKFYNIKSSLVFWGLMIFYLLHIAGLLNSSDTSEGLFDLQIKFSFLLLPIIIFLEKDFFRNNMKFILSAFVLGNILAGILCFTNAYFLTEKTNENYFVYSYFSIFHHSSYASMYSILSACILLFFIETPTTGKKIMSIVGITFLFVFIYFIGSRAGIITAGALSAFLILRYLYKKKKWLLLACSLLLFFSVPFAFKNHPRFIPVINFINNGTDTMGTASTENVTLRYLIIKESVNIISDNFFFGVGTGDVKASLLEKYKEKNMIMPLNEKLNTHNQFLETFIGLGILGAISLLLLIFYSLIDGFRTENILLVCFLLIIISNFMFEAMLNTQAGTIFFAFFYSLLSLSKTTRPAPN